jgi:hypothetical protein
MVIEEAPDWEELPRGSSFVPFAARAHWAHLAQEFGDNSERPKVLLDFV